MAGGGACAEAPPRRGPAPAAMGPAPAALLCLRLGLVLGLLDGALDGALAAGLAAPVYVSSWAVRVSQGPREAERLARKFGFVNLGQVGGEARSEPPRPE